MTQRPNFLLLFPDQQRYDSIAAAGYPHMQTPHLDQLMREGCHFKNAYTTNPLCMPARYSLLTGMPAREHGFWGIQKTPILDAGIPTLPRALSDNGYFTAAVGKMHFSPTRRHHGFHQMHLMEELPKHLEDDSYLQHLAANGYEDLRNIHGVRPLIYHEPQRALMPEEHYGENWVTQRSIEVIKANRDRPFFLQCGWIKPHPPWSLPEGCDDLYRESKLPEPIPISRERPYYDAPSDWYGDHETDAKKRAIREAYYGCVSMIDRSVGAIMDYLKESGLLENTVVIFASDHGEMLQDKGFYQKGIPYESSARVPLVIRYPERFSPGSVDDRLCDLMDIFPTLLDIAEIDYNYQETHKKYRLAGGSLLPDADDSRDRQVQRLEYGRGGDRWISLRDARYKYIYFYTGGIEQFYDLESDPQELHNLVGADAELPEAYQFLKEKCLEMELELGPDENVKDGKYTKYDYIPNKHSGTKYPVWSHVHHQTFGNKTTAEEARLFTDELRQAAGVEDTAALLQELSPEKCWREDWFKEFQKWGGTEEDRQQIWGK